MRRLKSVVLCFAAVAAVTLAVHAQTAPDNTLTAAERSSGWRLLFDGSTIDQWRGFKLETLPAGWTVEDGTLVHTPPARDPQTSRRPPTRDIISKDEFASFDFRFDWQVVEGGNSGVMYYVTEDGAETYHTGPEYQLLHNAGHADGKIPSRTAASCYDLYIPSKDATKPVGEWNQSRILIDKGHVEHWLNGEKVVEFEIGSADWNAKVEASKFGSKFPEMKLFGKARRGHLALQQHGARAAYKNLKIRELK